MSEDPTRPTAVRPTNAVKTEKEKDDDEGESEPITGPQRAVAEADGGYVYDPKSTPVLPGPRFAHITESAVTNFQLNYNAAFIPALLSSYRYAPIHSNHELFGRIRKGLDALDQRRVLLVIGKTDPIITPQEAIPDWKAVLGEDGVETVVVECGHEVPMGRADEVADAVWRFWQDASVMQT